MTDERIKKGIPALLLALPLLLAAACDQPTAESDASGTGTTETTTTTTITTTVYAAGTMKNSSGNYPACMWKDGTQTALGTDSDNPNSVRLAVSGSDVYIASAYSSRWAVWKNGEQIYYASSNDDKGSIMTGIAVSGSDVYISGARYAGSTYVAGIWKNGTWTAYGGGEGNSFVNDIAYSDGICYACGHICDSNDNPIYGVWKDGVWTAYSDASDLECIAVDSGSVYVGGTVNPNGTAIPAVWKDGTYTVYGDGTTGGYIFRILVANSAVYAAGYMMSSNDTAQACYWKDGVETELSDGTAESQGTCIYVDDSDVYVGGHITYDVTNSLWQAGIWKNGTWTGYSDTDTADGSVYAIGIVKTES